MIPLGGLTNPWKISADERRKHDEQFLSLNSIGGYITGAQAREFFMKSNLQAAVLAQIWDLSDLGKDGKMDKREFSIAMHLIQKKLQGVPLPSILPESMKSDPVANSLSSTSRMPIASSTIGVYSTQPLYPQSPVIQPTISSAISASSLPQPVPNAHVDWTMSHSSRLKYSQQFNGIDKDKLGYLSGTHARGLFGRSDLPSSTLARIWFLSDLDRDGRLTVDEFCIASHLIDMVKRGAALPSALPPELAPANWQHGMRLQRACSIGGSDTLFIPNSPVSTGDGDLIKAPKMAMTFEDKRRQNMERGQAEIERRRMLLQEEEKRQQEVRERKQREERERMEREQQEKERRRQMEIERQQAKMREEQEKREQEFRQMLEQKQAAREEAERQRKLDLERQRFRELRNQHQHDYEAVLQAKGKHKNLSLRVQSLSEKTREMNDRITAMRSSVIDSTSSLEIMKARRDKTLADIEKGNRQVQELKTRLMQRETEKLTLSDRRPSATTPGTPSAAYHQILISCQQDEKNLMNLRRTLTEIEEQIRRKQLELDNREKSSKIALDKARMEVSAYRSLIQRVNSAVGRLRDAKGRTAVAAGNGSWRRSNGHSGDGAQKVNTALYQAIYDFEGTNEGELTMKVGDAVTVFVDHPVEEGWLAGQIGDKVGWFPRDFAVLVGDQPAIPQPIDAQFEVSENAEVVFQQEPEPVNTGNQNGAGEWHVAVYPFQASQAGDLGFEVGERIFVVQKSDEWWTGRIDDREGIFPSTYVQALESSMDYAPNDVGQNEDAPSVTLSAVPPVEQQGDGDGEGGTVEVARVIAQFRAAAENQLSLDIGELVRVRSKSPAGWWEGEVQRKGEPLQTGWFPGNYVELLQSSDNDNASRRSSSERKDTEEQEVVEAIFDYMKQQDDELSFTKGSVIVILDKMADSWWKGQLPDGQTGLFPANYVKSTSPTNAITNGDKRAYEPTSSTSSTPTSELRKRTMYCQELEQTEQNYADDLQMVVDVFYKQLEVSGLLTPKEMSTLFINWTQLLSTARSFIIDLRSTGEDQAGATILKNMDNLKRVFITFCRHQQSSLDFLEAKEKSAARFRALHAQCSQHPAARGLQLSYFLLIPLVRVTKYHLVVKEILKYTPKEHVDYGNLQNAHSALRQLCDEANEVATETENLQTLYWCQNHIRCDQIQPKLVFHSQTNSLCPRRFVHSGILHKVSSGRLLVGLLFNDFLMLTTPDEKISQPDVFKLSRNSDISLTLYKIPVLLTKASLQTAAAQGSTAEVSPADECAFILHYGDDAVNLKAVSINAKTLWVKQLEKAIKLAKESASVRSRPATGSAAGIGRLLFEVVFVRNLVVPQDCKGASFYIEFCLGGQKHTKSIDLTRTDTLCTTQMVLEAKSGAMKLAIFAERTYSPDVCVGRAELELDAMLKMSASQRNPAVMQLPLTSDFTTQNEVVSGHVIVKFVVQLYDVQ